MMYYIKFALLSTTFLCRKFPHIEKFLNHKSVKSTADISLLHKDAPNTKTHIFCCTSNMCSNILGYQIYHVYLIPGN